MRTNLGSRRCTCEPNIAAGVSLTIIEGQQVSPRFARQVDPTTAADTLKIVLLGDEVSFDCAVESADVTEVSIWWQKDEANLTITNEEKYSLKVKQRDFFKIFDKVRFNSFIFQITEQGWKLNEFVHIKQITVPICKKLKFSRLTRQARAWCRAS